MSPYLSSLPKRIGELLVVSFMLFVLLGCNTMAGVAKDPPEDIPSFPWPPPRPTSTAALDRALLIGGATTLGDVANRLNGALGQVGYTERSFYSVPGGFALATRLEQIEIDGTPKAEPMRWAATLPPRNLFSLGDYLRALFTAPEGNYRVIVFVISNKPFTTAAEVTEDEAKAWLSGGLNRLPDSIASGQFGPSHAGTALVYQFRKKSHGQEPIANPDGAPSATQQLARTGILDALGR